MQSTHAHNPPRPNPQEFAALFKEQRAQHAGLFFTLPVFLLASRLLTSMLFTGLYPLWAQTKEGALSVQQVRHNATGLCVGPCFCVWKNGGGVALCMCVYAITCVVCMCFYV